MYKEKIPSCKLYNFLAILSVWGCMRCIAPREKFEILLKALTNPEQIE